MRRILVAIGLVVAIIAAPAASAACDTPEFRQFDFWLGDWRVLKPDGSFAGTNRVTSEYGGCVVHEHYVTGKGYSGESLNIYDAARKVWHQTWTDNEGLLLTLEGHLVGKSMILEGVSVQPNGVALKQRITWSPSADGSVRQLWEATDEKGAWSVAFDGKYTKK